MDAIEKAIRQAFEKGDARDRAFREKVYRSAFSALERTLSARTEMAEDAKRVRRERLQAKITEIETEFMPARQAAAPVPQAEPRPAPAPMPPLSRRAAPTVAADLSPHLEPEDRRTAPRKPSARDNARRIRAALPRKRRPFAMLFLVATLVAFFGIGAWWSITSGLFLSSEQRDTSVPNPPLRLEEEDYAGDAPSGSRPTGNWITVFSPTDPTTVAAPGNASADVMQEEGRALIRINSDADTAIVFDVGQGVLETLAGKRAMFSVDARAQDGEETQISISCHFGSLGGCGRTRYVVGATRSDYLFEVDLPEGNPGSGGTIAIVPDIDGQRRALDIFGIRAAVATR